ncbi:MAG: tetratricopeptide repeat protein [Anaerolineae bacterium]|nr:tetratricopeptide repeat protein [Anaerolineae bacterium]
MSRKKSSGKLNLKLLGSPEVWLDGQVVTGFRSGKARALLYYLAVSGRAQPRSVLTGLFWGEVAEQHARRSLTMTLSNLRQLLGSHLDIARETVAFDANSPYWLDVPVFEAGVAAASQGQDIEELKQAIALYRGDFLEGFYLHDAPEFEQWVLVERARLRERVLRALHLLADHLAAQDDLPQAIETMRRLLALEPWREEAHRYLMLLLARDGQRSAALAQFEICRQMLADELAVEPGPETIALYEQIRAGELSGGAGERRSRRESFTPAPLHTLPPQLTPFVGREGELAEIIRRLTDRHCRLLTLVGPGGIGKTRLALQVAQRLIPSALDEGFFGHGIYFVPLASASSTTDVLFAVAEAVGVSFYGNVSPKQQLLDYLQKKEMLLVLDDLEHLLSAPLISTGKKDFAEQGDARMTDFIADILAAAPDVKILATSREALNLQEAWFHPVEGMSFPAGGRQFMTDNESEVGADVASLERYDAVQLFVQSAARARVKFSLAAERAAVVRLCRLVEGMPLAIELAAAWLKVLPVEAIVAEIERGLDILTSRHQNVPERHRSMRVVLEQSWQLLAAHEREVFQRLSVFRGGFGPEAARAIAGASLIELAAFVEKSLLQVSSTGRYHIHELLRQYAAERLADTPESVAKIYEAHCTYFADFLQQHAAAMLGGQQRQAVAATAAEYDNIWTAWRWALKALKLAEIEKLAGPLQGFFQFQSRYLEGATAWEEAYQRLTVVEVTDPIKLALVHVIIWWGWMLIRLGRLDQAEAVLQQCRELYRQLGIPAVPGYGTDPALPLSLIATIRGDYALALQYGEQALRESETQRHKPNLSLAYYALASAAFGQGHYQTARQYAQQAYTLAQQRDDRWFMAYCLNLLGESALALGDVTVAQHHIEASYRLRQEFNDPEGMAVALHHLGKIALQQKHYERAQQLYQKSLDIYQNIFDKGGLARVYQGLGTVASRQGDVRRAQLQLRQALQLAAEIQFVPLMVSILKAMGELLLNSNRPEYGLRVLAFVRQHPASDRTTRVEAQQLLDRYRTEAEKEKADILAAVQAYAENRTLPDVVAEILSETA